LRTNIEIDDGLLAEVMAATGLRTTRKVVEASAAPGAAEAAGRRPQAVRERLDEPDDPDRG